MIAPHPPSDRPMRGASRAAMAASLVLAGAGLAIADDPPERPNVVVILADDMGYGEPGCYGHPRFKTPNLDRMAAEGARLTQFNTAMPFCARPAPR